jgi:hypothetical protein
VRREILEWMLRRNKLRMEPLAKWLSPGGYGIGVAAPDLSLHSAQCAAALGPSSRKMLQDCGPGREPSQ